jgi:integrase
MSIERTPAGTYRVRWRDIDGRQRSRNVRTETEAKRLDRAVQVDTDRGVATGRPRRMSVTAWADEWLTGAHNLRAKTRHIYHDTIDHLGELGDTPLGRLTPAQIDRWLADRAASGLAPSTVNRHYRVLRTMLRAAHQRGHILTNPIAAVREPKVPATEMRFLDAGQLEHLATTIDARYRTLVLVAGWGGLRWGEIAALTVARVDTTGGRVHVVEQLDAAGRVRSEPKTAAGRRWVTLPGSVATELADHVDGRAPGEPVWTMPGGGPLVHSRWRGTEGRPVTPPKGAKEPEGRQRWEVHPRGFWRRAVVAGGLDPLRFHDLRHTSVGLAVAAGMHPRVIQARLGHASIEVTLGIYGHVMPGIDTAAAADLDRLREDGRRLRAV